MSRMRARGGMGWARNARSAQVSSAKSDRDVRACWALWAVGLAGPNRRVFQPPLAGGGLTARGFRSPLVFGAGSLEAAPPGAGELSVGGKSASVTPIDGSNELSSTTPGTTGAGWASA